MRIFIPLAAGVEAEDDLLLQRYPPGSLEDNLTFNDELARSLALWLWQKTPMSFVRSLEEHLAQLPHYSPFMEGAQR